jgi:tight adherence protein B
VLSARLLKAEPLTGRVLILLTDGQEISSRATLPRAIDTARNAGVAVYPVAIQSSKFSPAPLKELAQATGGTYYAAASTAGLTSVYAAIAAELQRTWRLRYVTAARPGERFRLDATAPGVGAATAQVTLPGGPGTTREPARPSGLLPERALHNPLSPLLIGLAVGVLLLLAGVLLTGARRSLWVRARLAPHLEQARAAKREGSRERFATGAAVLQATERAFGHLRVWRKVNNLLERADVPLRTVEFLYLCAGSGFVTGLIAAVTGRSSSLVILVALAGGALLPFAVVWFKARRRLKAFENQLPDLLLTIAASLKAGHSFKQGLQTVVDEGQPPASKEFNRVLTEARLGRPMDEALADMSRRVGSKNLDFVITAVTIQTQVGGSLAGLFDMVAEAVRQRQQFARKIKGLTAMGRASAYVLVAMPFFMAALLTLLSREYMAPLWDSSTGHKLIYAMLISMAVGSLMLKKIVSFKG